MLRVWIKPLRVLAGSREAEALATRAALQGVYLLPECSACNVHKCERVTHRTFLFEKDIAL